ncbi:MAG: redoxin domain-containing protein [Bacillota bacterium]
MQEVLQLQPYFPEWRNKGVQVLLIAQEQEPAARFLAQHDLDLVALLDARGEAAAAYNAYAVPQTVWVDKAGIVRHVSIGWGERKLAEFADLAETLSR